MNLIEQIQTAAIDENVKVSALLMKCCLLALKLDAPEFKRWIFRESEGYDSGTDVPAYRVVPVALKWTVNTRTARITGHSVPVEHIPEKIKNLSEPMSYRDSIAAAEYLISGSKNKGSVFISHGNIARLFGKMTNLGVECLDLWQEISISNITDICNSVRIKILDYSIALQKEFPEVKDIAGIEKLTKSAGAEGRLTQIFHTTISGGGNVITGAVVDSEINISAGNFLQLSEHLARNGVSGADIEKLKEAVNADTNNPQNTSGKFGKHVSEWFGRMVAKAASGTWNMSADKAANFLISALGKFLGM